MGSTQAQIAVSYDVSNDFFRLWLDERMVYTSAIFDDDGWHTDSLEAAQTRKLEWHHAAAHIEPDMRVLDLGCGWGGNLAYLAAERGVRACHGVTLSKEQGAWIRERNLPNVTVQIGSWTDFEPEAPFDAIENIGMLEHLASPEEARSGRHIAIYREFFRRCRAWTRPGAWMSFQTILRNRFPRSRDEAEAMGHVNGIFPGGMAPRLEDIAIAVNPHWEIRRMVTRRLDYQRTCAAWRERLRGHERTIRERWGERLFADYDRYLSTCQWAFGRHYHSLLQCSLSRIDG